MEIERMLVDTKKIETMEQKFTHEGATATVFTEDMLSY